MTPRPCNCSGYAGCGHASPAVTPSQNCNRWGVEESGLCQDCEVSWNAAIGRAVRTLLQLVNRADQP